MSVHAWRALHAPDIIGESEPILRALDQARRAARTDDPVRLRGDAGTGSELFARAIHRASSRDGAPFMVVNCAAIPEALLEAELFGSQRGQRVGRIASAHGGTIFFEEIADLSLVIQVKLLRVIDQGVVCALGSNLETTVDVRIMGASKHDLGAMAARGSFRPDLLTRLGGHVIELPTLNERGRDVCMLAEAMLRDPAARHGVDELDVSARIALLAYPWPGNLPELHKAVERGLRHAVGKQLTAEDLDLERRRRPAMVAVGSDPGLSVISDEVLDDEQRAAVEVMDRRLIDQALVATRGNRREAARRLGMRQTQLIARLKLRKQP